MFSIFAAVSYFEAENSASSAKSTVPSFGHPAFVIEIALSNDCVAMHQCYKATTEKKLDNNLPVFCEFILDGCKFLLAIN